MFSGIVMAVGMVAGIRSDNGARRMHFAAGTLDLADAHVGDSIAINGVCLTVVECSGTVFAADVSSETLSCTTLGHLAPGDAVNLEKALLPTTRLGGHLVSGHVDGVGTVTAWTPDGDSRRARIEVPGELARYVATKGSICIDGVSLTVNRVDGATFEVNLVPHTLKVTTLGAFDVGRRVNIEVDVIARYLERLLAGAQTAGSSRQGVTMALLKRSGFID